MSKADLSLEMELTSADKLIEAVTRSQRGDAEAFHQLFRRYSRPVLGFVYDLVGDRALAEEIAQETFVRAYRSLANLREAAKFSTWLFGIARNIVREALKEKYANGRKVGLDEPASQHLEDGAVPLDQQIIDGELNDAIRAALAELNEDWRTVFVLKIFHQLSYEEIAETTGWTIAKVKTDLHRARLEMRRKLQSFLT